MSQSQNVTLDDKEVSRRLAHRAMHDKVFKHELLACASPDFAGNIFKGSGESYMSVSRAIIAIRAEMVDQAGLEVPLLKGIPQDLDIYLKRTKTSRVLLGKASVANAGGDEVVAVGRDREWGWLVSHQPCAQRQTISYLV